MVPTPTNTATSTGPSHRRRRSFLIALPIVLLAVGLALSSSPSVASPGWELILDRPAPNFQAIDFVSASEGWLVASTGLLHTTDGGATWEEAVPIGGLAVDMADAEHGWLVGFSGAIYHTSDGATWSAQSSGTNVHLSDVYAVSAQEAWAVGTGVGYPDVAPIRPLPAAFLHTTDGGTTWREVETPPDSWFGEITFVGEQGWAVGSVCALPDSRSPCPSTTRSLFHTEDGGDTWALLGMALPISMHDLVFVDELRGWAVGHPAGVGTPWAVFHTKDGGLTWDEQMTGSSTTFPGPFAFRDETSGWLAVTECPDYRCSVSLVSTTDGGATWTTDAVIGQGGSRQQARTLLITDEALYLAGTDLALSSEDFGRTWTLMEHPAMVAWALDFIDRRNGYADSRGILLRTTDTGRSWTRVGPAPSVRSLQLAFLDIDHGFAAGSQCDRAVCEVVVYESADGGTSWTKVFSDLDDVSAFPREIDFVDEVHGWLAMPSHVFITDDGGVTWERRDFGEVELLDVVRVDALHMWAAVRDRDGGSDRLLRSTDAGRTWTVVRRLSEGSPAMFAFADDQHAWYAQLVCDERCRSEVLATDDGGETWRDTGLEPMHVRDMGLVDALNGWVSGTRCGESACEGAIVHTADGSLTWSTQASGEDFAGTLSFVDVETGWLAPLMVAGGPPQRTRLYHTSDGGGGPVGREEPTPDFKFPIVGGQTPGSGAASVLRPVLLLAGVAGALGTGAFLVRVRRRR